jgi:probable biosynthetic protein (TIGR04098 family)
MTYVYDLTLGLPHTNHRGLSEHLLLEYAGHFQWRAICAAAGAPLSRLRSTAGSEVYASFYYIEERIPPTAALESFGLDDTLRFAIALRSFKNIAIEGRLVFDRHERLLDTRRVEAMLAATTSDLASPFIRFANIFITPEGGNSRLRVAPPADVDFSALPTLPNDDNPYHLTRAAGEHGRLGVLDEAWLPVASYQHRYDVDVDRDTNGAGLVYFANFVAFMDTAERLALDTLAPAHANAGAAARRSLRHRRIAYYGNAGLSDTLLVRVAILRHPAHPDHLGFRYSVERQEDRETICRSEAVKALPTGAGDWVVS